MRVGGAIVALLFAAYAGAIMGGAGVVSVAAAADTGSAQVAVHQAEGAGSQPSGAVTHTFGPGCKGCIAVRLKLGALTLLAGFVLFVGGFALVGRSTASNGGRAQSAEVRED